LDIKSERINGGSFKRKNKMKFEQKDNMCNVFKSKSEFSDFSGVIKVSEAGEYWINLKKKESDNAGTFYSIVLKKKEPKIEELEKDNVPF